MIKTQSRIFFKKVGFLKCGGRLKKVFYNDRGKTKLRKKKVQCVLKIHDICVYLAKYCTKQKKVKLSKILGNGLNNVTHFFLMSNIHQSQNIIIELLLL